MPAIQAHVAPRHASGRWGAPIEGTLTVLELVASEQPEFLEFQAHVLCNSTMSFAMQKIAADLSVPPEHVGKAIGRACMDLNRLEKQPGKWRDPTKILGAPNLRALRLVCRARLGRILNVTRRRRLESIERRIDKAYKLAQTRTWIDAFIGPLPAKPRKIENGVR